MPHQAQCGSTGIEALEPDDCSHALLPAASASMQCRETDQEEAKQQDSAAEYRTEDENNLAA
jgi:hypothetical protein